MRGVRRWVRAPALWCSPEDAQIADPDLRCPGRSHTERQTPRRSSYRVTGARYRHDPGRPFHRLSVRTLHRLRARGRARIAVSLSHADEPSFGVSFCARRRGAERRFRTPIWDGGRDRPRGSCLPSTGPAIYSVRTGADNGEHAYGRLRPFGSDWSDPRIGLGEALRRSDAPRVGHDLAELCLGDAGKPNHHPVPADVVWDRLVDVR
jgi:hypothetical protein